MNIRQCGVVWRLYRPFNPRGLFFFEPQPIRPISESKNDPKPKRLSRRASQGLPHRAIIALQKMARFHCADRLRVTGANVNSLLLKESNLTKSLSAS